MSPAAYGSTRRVHTGARFLVFRARREGGRAAVVKQALPGRPELRGGERLAHELEILRSLGVPGTSRPIELTTVDGNPALVVEDAGQRNLAEALEGRPLPTGDFLDLAVQMARILHGIHERSVIHRDIAPENFVLGEGGAVTLVDFESATTVPAFAEGPGIPGALDGSLAHMPPEQAGRMKRLVDRRADLYALGATFYEMLTGRPPFHARDPLELVHALAAHAPSPPAILNPSVPAAVSDVVVKLLAKMPEHRYQTARALAADLEEARRQWRARGEIDLPELGRLDVPYGLLLASERLHGRDREVAQLRAAVERAGSGGPEVVLVTGPAGIGKSSLVAHVRELSEGSARWISGKGDLLRSNVPRAPLVEALRDLVQAALREPEEAVAALRARLQCVAAPGAGVLLEAIPDLRPLLGDQPPPSPVGPVEEENRFQLALSAFLRELLSEGPPLVLFLDDVQWMDAASLHLVRSLATDPDLRSLLIVCAYRSDEAGPGHPVTRTLDAVRGAGARVTEIPLGPLGPDALLALLCESLRADPAQVRPLARVVRRKTAANPFFVRQFLGYLHRAQLLCFDLEAARWTWDLAGIAAADVTPNVVDLLSRVLEALPAEAQDALRAASCIGNRFELCLLAGARGEPMDATARALWAPIQQGLIVPSAEGQRFPWAGDKPVELGTAAAPTYRFVHDRIQQAAYASLSEDARRSLHLAIGRWLERHAPEEDYERAAGAIADQLNRAAEQLSGEERVRLASLNERAGRQARAEAALRSALRSFQAGLELLPPEPWKGAQHALWFALLSGAAECAGLTGEHALSERLVDEGVSRTSSALERAALLAASVQANALHGEHARAVRRAREGLAVLGMELPPDPISPEAARAERERVSARLDDRSERQLLEARAMAGDLDRAGLQLLVRLSSSWFVDPELFQLVASRAAELTASKGIAPGSAVAFAFFAMARAMAGEHREAYRYARLAADLAERMGDPGEEGRVLLCLGGHVSAWSAPFSESVSTLQRAHARALEAGDLEFASYALANLGFTRSMTGEELDQLLVEVESTLAFHRKIHHRGAQYVAPLAQAIRCLKGWTRAPASFDDDRFQEARFLEEARDNGLALATFHVQRVMVCSLMEEPELALAYAAKARAWLPYLRTIYLRSGFHFHAALALAALRPECPPAADDAALAGMREHLARLETWAENAPMNFAHRRDLVAAELARVEGRAAEALSLYHGAIEQAGRGGFVQDEALAHELCARFHRARGAGQVAELHLDAASSGYWSWGATAKAELVDRQRRFPGAKHPRAHVPSPAPPPALDALSLVRAAETLTEELELDRLLEKLVRVCAEAANAQRAVLVLDEGGLTVRAIMEGPSEVLLERRPLSASPAAPQAIVEDAFRAGEVMVLGSAAREGRYAADPYVSAHGVLSVLAVPIARAGRTLGVLYFENDLASEAFTPDRVEMLRLLSAPVAIAIENSRLFEERRRSEAALRLLARASHELSETLEYDQVLSRVCAIAVPAMADWCVLEALEDGGLSPAAWAHADPAAAPDVRALRLGRRVDAAGQEPQAQVLRTGKPLLISEVTEDLLLAGARDEEHLRIARALDPRSLMVCPLVARGRTVGVLTLASSRPSRRYEASDLSLAELICRRAGLALDNARLHRDLRRSLRTLRERDRQLAMIFHQQPGAVWATGRDLRITYEAGRSVVDLGRGPERHGPTLYDRIGTRDPTEPAIAHHLAALGGERQSFEYEFRDGRWYSVLLEPARDRQGRIARVVGAAFDVTERRAAQERLALSERRLGEAQRVAHVGSFEWDIRPDTVTWSDELHRIYGLEPGQFAGTFEAFLERVHPAEVESTRKIIFDAFREPHPFAYEHRILRADGRVRVLLTRGDVIKDENGQPVRMVGTCWDITELTEATRERERSLSLLQATIEATGDGILVVDRDRKVVVHNRRFLELWRFPEGRPPLREEEEMLEQVLPQLEDSSAFLRRCAALPAGSEAESIERLRLHDGRVFECYSRPQRVAGAVAGRVWSFRDISQRERQLRNALFLADATRLLASLDVEQALDSVARAAVPLLGDWCAIDLFADGAPRRVAEVSNDPKRHFAPEVHATVFRGHSVVYRVEEISYLGVPLAMKGNLLGAMTFAGGPRRRYGPGDLELAEELARRSALAIDNAQLYRRAQEALSARDEFLAIAAHEIRGPVTAIHLAVQSIKASKVSPKAIPRLLDLVEKEDRRLTHFVDELMDLGRIRSGTFRLEYQDVDLVEVARDAVARLGPQIASSGSALTVSARGPVVGHWDRFRLEQVAGNLISNAIKFGMSKPIEVTVSAEGEQASLTVTDHGMGMEPEIRERVFKPFERGVSVRHYGGLGLGLHIVKTIVDAMGGSVGVESEPGRGSTFRVDLPRFRPEAGRGAHPGA